MDLVRRMRDNLHSLAEIVSATLLLDYTLIDLPSRDVVIASEFDIQKAFIVAEIQIYLTPISQHEDFSMLIGTHCSSITILNGHLTRKRAYEVGINLNRSHFHSMSLEQSPKRTDRYSFAQSTQYSASNNEIFHV